MQLQCLEVPRSVEICLKSTRRPKTQIHFPNPRTLTRVELTSLSAISACDSRERTVSHHLLSNSPAHNVKRQRCSGEDVLHCRSEDLASTTSLSGTRQGEQRLDARERCNNTSTPPDERLYEGQGDRPFSSPNSSLVDKGLVYQTITTSGCEISSTCISAVNTKPRCPSAARRPTRNKSQPRKNCWGGTSYTDLITAAIESSPHKRMSLAQIYDWIVKNVPYFKDKECYLSVQGWKNTVRHTLSIRRRFIRIKDPKRPYRSMWTVGEEEGTRRVTQAATKRLKARTGTNGKELLSY